MKSVSFAGLTELRAFRTSQIWLTVCKGTHAVLCDAPPATPVDLG